MEFSVYVKLDENGRIIDINSSLFLKDPSGWVEVARGVGDRFQHAQGNYLPKPMFNMGVPVYKMEMGEIKERSEEEIRADIKAPGKTEIEKRIETIEKSVKVISDLLAKLGMK